MNGPMWRIDDEDGSPEITGTPRPLLVTGRAIRDALARTWRIWVGATIVGGILGVLAVVGLPRSATASTTLLMVHPNPGESAMTTDMTLLQTRAVASAVLAELDLKESPEALLSTVTVTKVNDQILYVTVSGPDQASAVARSTSLVNHFLEFRAKQMRSVAEGLIDGYEKKIAGLKSQVDSLTREYDRLSSATKLDDVRASDILASRATMANQITVTQSDVEEASLETNAAILATHVIDAPRAAAVGLKRQLMLFAASGALLGGALSVGIILFRVLTSDRLRQRREVATALGVPVRVGVGAISPRGVLRRTEAAVMSWVARHSRHAASRATPALASHLNSVRWSERGRQRNLEALIHGLESALPPRLTNGPRSGGNHDTPRRAGSRSAPATLGLAAVDRADTAAAVLRAAADRMAERGVQVLLVDLSSNGARAGSPGLSNPSDATRPRTFRPEGGDPALSHGPRRIRRHPERDPDELGDLGVAWDEADLVLVLLEVDPGIHLDVVRTWVNRIVPLVTAGRANSELLSTIAGLVAEAGLEMPFALLEGADRSDQTLGQPPPMAEDPDALAAAQSS
jgi:capsular polysaccharide biosynthesis protein